MANSYARGLDCELNNVSFVTDDTEQGTVQASAEGYEGLEINTAMVPPAKLPVQEAKRQALITGIIR